jgi:hypothetical protein
MVATVSRQHAYPMSSIFKQMHFHPSSLICSQLLCGMNSLEVFKSPSMQTSFGLKEINVNTPWHIIYNPPAWCI